MDMSITHATPEREETGYVRHFVRFEAQITAGGTLAENSFSLETTEGAWARQPVRVGDYLYIGGTEWGGPVDAVSHDTKTRRVTLEGPYGAVCSCSGL